MSKNWCSISTYTSTYHCSLVILLIFNLFYFCDIVICGSCLEAKLCCPGRDSSCVVQNALMNSVSVVQDYNEKPCYCDHACLRLGDCCVDFKKTCNVVDCLVSIWYKWSECDTNCGGGMMLRTRKVLKEPINGGKHCPPLIQKRACLGTNCPQNPRSALKEIAMLLPAKFSNVLVNANISSNETTQKLESSEPAFKNARNHENSGKKYCVLFHVLKASKACTKELFFSNLQEGEEVCVHCDDKAMRPSLGFRCAGHGTMDRSTKWIALSAPHCHGKWVRLNSSPQVGSNSSILRKWSMCHGQCPNGPHYVFV